MAMSGSTLGTAIKGALISAGYAEDGPDLEGIWQTIASEIITHIVANGVVTTTVASPIAVQVDPNTGTGATTSPGTGTGTIA